LAALAQETWGRFLAAFPARSGCFGDVRLHAAYRLDSRAEYNPATATATVLVPGTRTVLQSELIHEWAHHLDFQCPAIGELRPAFVAAQGLRAGTPWRPAGGTTDLPESQWAEIPSEQFAEAAIEVVMGSNQPPTTVVISPQAVQLVRAWGEGR
jgi:hypothetical protein